MIKVLKSDWVAVILFLMVAVVTLLEIIRYQKNKIYIAGEPSDSTWVAPSLFTDAETAGKERELVIYGEELIAHTGNYFGPKGSVVQITNGMNC